MRDPLKSHVKRLQRLLEIRQTLADAAEVQVRDSEHQVRNLEGAREAVAGTIESTRAEIAHRGSLSGSALHMGENYILALNKRYESIRKNLENAKGILELRRREWVEAIRNQKIVETLQDRRLLELRRKDEAESQKSMDDAFNARLGRSRTDR